jgi:Peptidase family M28
MHKTTIPAVILASLMFVTSTLVAQTQQSASGEIAEGKSTSKFSQITTASADPQIMAALRQVATRSLRATVDKLVSFVNRSTLSANNEKLMAQGFGVANAAKWIESEFQRYSKECGGCLEVKTDTFIQQPEERIKEPTQITNVYAVLRGSDPENAKRIYLVTGHYDSRNSDNFNTSDPAPGANDDASGTAVSLECARVLSKIKFPATIVFLTVAGEEQGLDGSRHFAKMAKEQGWNIEAVLNNDIVGGNTTPGDALQNKNEVRVFSEGVPNAASDADLRLLKSLGGENDSTSRQLARYIRETSQTYLPGAFHPKLIFRRDRYLRGGDHTSFNNEGFAAVRFTEFREDFHHQHQNVRTENGIDYGDLPKYVDFNYVADVARLNAATLASLAAAPAPPANPRLITRNLENDTSLTWEPSPGGLASGYEVLIRTTEQPYWEQASAVGNVSRSRFSESKDNVIFGIRAVDGKGHKSLVIIPQPQR